MTRVDLGHTSGQFTDPWYPPVNIDNGQVVEWRSESDGVMTGAIGHAKYSVNILDDSGNHTEFVEIDWDNPYWGTNSSNAYAFDDFSGDPSTDLIISNCIQSGSVPNAAKVAGLDFEAWLDTLLFPPYILANAVSWNDTNALYGVQYQPPPPPPQLGGKDVPPVDLRSLPRKLNTDANPAQWRGDWQADGIYVTLLDDGGGNMSAYVTDRTMNPMIQFTQQFTFGEPSWVGQHLVYAAIAQDLGTNSAVSKVFQGAAAAALSAAAQGAEKDPQKVFQTTATSLAKNALVNLNAAGVSKAGASISSFALNAVRSTAYLMYGITLRLYDVFSGGVKQGQLLNYKRCDGAGRTLTDALLAFVPVLR
jgi:hypothetical protein